jgi:TPR repeat
MAFFSSRRAEELHQAGMKCSAAGDEEGALENYSKALALDPNRSDTLYNIGLIYKYRRAWPESLEFNRRARTVEPDDEATLWNLAIAATALQDWQTAREVWRHLNIFTEAGEGPIADDFGSSPVRQNAYSTTNSNVEVVWARRLCPVRARIDNIPTGATGFRYGDVVLHDGAGVGSRLNANGQERPVFNVLELFEPSRFSTYEASIEVRSPEGVQALEKICEQAHIPFEDWTASLKVLCKACSEGSPHENHDQELKEPRAWNGSRRIGFATVASDQYPRIQQCLDLVVDLKCTLDARLS